MTKLIHSCTTVCVCVLFTPQILCLFLVLRGFQLELSLPIGVHLLDICGSHFPKQFSIFSHVPPTVDYRRKWYKSVCRLHQSKRSTAVEAIRKSSHSVWQFQEDLQGITWDRLKRIISYDRFCSGKQPAKKNLWFLGSQNGSLGWASPSKYK